MRRRDAVAVGERIDAPAPRGAPVRPCPLCATGWLWRAESGLLECSGDLAGDTERGCGSTWERDE